MLSRGMTQQPIPITNQGTKRMINQTELIGVILLEINYQGVESLDQQQFNAVVEAANSIVAAFSDEVATNERVVEQTEDKL